MRSPEMPVGANSIPFSAESIYQKAFRNQQPSKPSLPIIQRQNLSLPKTIGAVKSTQRDSYAAMNPERQTNPAIIPINNLGTLTPFSHNFGTFFIIETQPIATSSWGWDSKVESNMTWMRSET